MASPNFKIAITNQQRKHALSVPALRKAVKEVLCGEQVQSATISLAIVDDPTIHELNRRFLQHDYPTDVLSFVLDRDEDSLDGEVIVSADTASDTCSEYGWSMQDELTLYVIHGLLHLVGFDDHSASDRKLMRAKEQEYLGRMNIQRPSRSDSKASARRKRPAKRS